MFTENPYGENSKQTDSLNLTPLSHTSSMLAPQNHTASIREESNYHALEDEGLLIGAEACANGSVD